MSASLPAPAGRARGDVIEACGFTPATALRPRTATFDNASSGRIWLDADRAITARLLLTQDGAKADWSRYGPLDLCSSEKELNALER